MREEIWKEKDLKLGLQKRISTTCQQTRCLDVCYFSLSQSTLVHMREGCLEEIDSLELSYSEYRIPSCPRLNSSTIQPRDANGSLAVFSSKPVSNKLCLNYVTSLRRCHSIFNLNTCYRSLECLTEICWFTSSLKGSNHQRPIIACNYYNCIHSLY